MNIVEETPWRLRIEPEGRMRVPGIVFASRELLVGSEMALQQVANVATLPGIAGASYAMPDVHWGYGFPIGGVAATDVAAAGVVSPGGVGFDISCGVRLLASPDLSRDALASRLESVMNRLDAAIPRGMGRSGVWRLRDREQLEQVLVHGARYAVECGHGVRRDLGSGNHFLEVQAVAEVYDAKSAAAMGLRPDQVCVMIHCGSRGLGHQICTDHVQIMGEVMPRYGISVPDRQLACAPVRSPEGRGYLGAMAAAANYARANRQLLGEATREVFESATAGTLDLVYDVSHNLAKLESHEVAGTARTLCVHRKGATRALPPHHPDLPPDLAAAGQPVLIPGTMGTASYVLAGVAGGAAFASTAHGAGRVRSRHQAARRVSGRRLRDELEARGILVRGASWRGLAEEAPDAYKDVAAVAEVSERAGLARRIARLVPLGVVKG